MNFQNSKLPYTHDFLRGEIRTDKDGVSLERLFLFFIHDLNVSHCHFVSNGRKGMNSNSDIRYMRRCYVYF